MNTPSLISLAACAGLLLSGCQSNKSNSASSPTYAHGTPAAASVPLPQAASGKIHVVWAPNSPPGRVIWFVDGLPAGKVAGSKSVTREKHWVNFYNLLTHSAFPPIAVLVDLSPHSNQTEATIKVTATSVVPVAPSPSSGMDNNSYTLAPYILPQGISAKINTVFKNDQACTGNSSTTVSWYRNGAYVNTVESVQTGLGKGLQSVHFYNHHDHASFPIPDMVVDLSQGDAKIKVCVKTTP